VDADTLGGSAFVYNFIASGLFSEPADDLEKLLGRPATSLREAVVTALA
jgi:NAD(P)H dehydrogenase (quinone)